MNVKKRGSRIGYIMGPGDEVAEALRQIGYEVTLLTDADLERGDFARYDAIVTGVRAYNTRKRLKLAQPKLLEYVNNGGTLVVQYNTLQELLTRLHRIVPSSSLGDPQGCRLHHLVPLAVGSQ